MDRVLVVDDEWNELEALLDPISREHGWMFSGVPTFEPERVLHEVERIEPSILLLDIIHADEKLPNLVEAGIRLFEELGKHKQWIDLSGKVQIIFFSAEATAHREYSIAKEKRLDVGGYLHKAALVRGDPQAMAIVRAAADQAELYRKYPQLADPALRAACDLLFSPNSIAMRKVWEKILLASRNWEPVLISGETGTGKELVAKAIFDLAVKRNLKQATPLRGTGGNVSCNIGAMPREGNLQYVELFGARTGAANNILNDRTGLFMRADRSGPQGGTVFLDEIGDTPPIIQVSLLRVLQEGVITPLGGFDDASGKPQEEKVNFRLISASHVDLKKAAEFRDDLYHRLSTIRIHVPPLRERKDDIGVLLYRFLDRLNDKKTGYGWDIHVNVEDEKGLLETLKRYDWPGNVRELEMAIRASYVSMAEKEPFRLDEEILKTIEEADARPTAARDMSLAQASPSLPSLLTAVSATNSAPMQVQPPPGTPDSSSEAGELRVCFRQLMLDPRATPTELIAVMDNLGEHDPRPRLSDLEMLFGVPATMEIYRLLAGRSGSKHLDDASARRYFDSSGHAVKRWFNRAERRLGELGATGETAARNRSPNGITEEEE